MRKFLLFAALLPSIFCQAQMTGVDDIVNAKRDISKLYPGNINLVGDGTTDNYPALKSFYDHHPDSIPTVYLPKGVYVFNSRVFCNGGIKIYGAGIGKTIVKFTSSFSGTSSTNLWEFNAASDIDIEGITFTGNAVQVKSALAINSAYTHNRHIRIVGNEFVDLWAKQAIDLGGAGPGETHTNDDVEIAYNWIHRIYKPSVPVIYSDSTGYCYGINLEQTTMACEVHHNLIDSTSGDGIFGWGGGTSLNPQGGWYIHHNRIYHNWMGIEINGGYLITNLSIADNDIRYATRNHGFLISVDAYYCQLYHNHLLSVERGMIEYTAICGSIKDNYGKIVSYNDSSGGLPNYGVTGGSIDIGQLYGYGNTVSGNSIELSKTGALVSTPAYFNGWSISGKTTDTLTQPRAYNGITDYTAYWKIIGNTTVGYNGTGAASPSANPARNVICTGNSWITRNAQKSTIDMNGRNWIVHDEVFDFTGSSAPTGGNAPIAISSLQSGALGEIIYNNTVVNPVWAVGKYKYYIQQTVETQ